MKADSSILSKDLSSMPKERGVMREDFRNNKKTCQDDGALLYVVTRRKSNNPKHSPSGAASFCTATAMQGTSAWVDNNNKTFGEVFPKEK